MRIRVWSPIWYGDALYFHDLSEPQVQVTSVAAALDTTRLPITVLPEDAVVVVNQETGDLTPRRHLPNLLFDPSQTGTGRCVDKNDPS